MKFIRDPYGFVIWGRGWCLRLGRLRLAWAPPPDPRVEKVLTKLVYKKKYQMTNVEITIRSVDG